MQEEWHTPMFLSTVLYKKTQFYGLMVEITYTRKYLQSLLGKFLLMERTHVPLRPKQRVFFVETSLFT